MNSRVRDYLIEIAGALLLGVTLALLIPQAHAGLIATDEAVGSAQAKQERDQLRTLVERPEIAAQLEKMGIAPDQAKARVDAMSDSEVHWLAGKLGSLPAGGALSNTDLLLVIIILLLLVLLL